MENNYNRNDELEQYLKDEADAHKMYPSEYVWENIRTSIHGNPAWPALTFIAIAIILTLTVSTVFNYPPKTIIIKTNTLVQKSGNIISDPSQEYENTDKVESLDQQINPNNYTAETLAAINDKNNIDAYIADATETLVNQKRVAISTDIIEQNKPTVNTTADHLTTISKDILLNDNAFAAFEKPSENKDASSLENATVQVNTKKSKYQSMSQKTVVYDENSADSYLNDFGFETKKQVKKPSGIELQFYVTPSISYRKLLEDDKLRLTNSPSILSTGATANVNNSVRHIPALGMEIGGGISYNLTPNFKVKTGLQFNIRQYYIDVTQSFGIATIALVQNNHLDSVSLFSMFSNSTGTNGYYSTKIDNKLYQISIPIGFQWDFLQGKKFGLSASASIQPTFTLNKNVYVISSDYKYYANGAPFFRKWNFNSSIDLDITYKTGNVKWYVGPQIRYQHLPTYNDIYPIKEYRMDYGLKVGITTPLFK